MSETEELKFKKQVAPLRIAALEGARDMAEAVDRHIVRTRRDMASRYPMIKSLQEDVESTYLLDVSSSHYGTGEGKVKFMESVRGVDLYIITDITNHSVTYKVCGHLNRMSPDNHFQDIKRIISAANGKAHRINVIMPFLYEGRQHKRSGQESLDCALALKELANYGVSNIITFDAHDPRVMNSIPLCGFDSFMPTHEFLRTLTNALPDLVFDKDHFMVVSPDEGAMNRGIYLSNIMGVDMGTFYKRRDYSRIVDGRNPIVAHEFLGDSVEGKDIVVIDDMISSGGSMLDVCRQLKDKGCNRVFICVTFGLFTNGLDAFDDYYEKGLFDKLVTTNLTYLPPELLARPYFLAADMYPHMAGIIDVINHDMTTNKIRSTTRKITEMLYS